MAEQKYVKVRLEDYERIVNISYREPRRLLEGLYCQLTGGSFIDKNHHCDIDRKEALKTAEELWELLGDIEKYFDKPPYDEDVYTKSEIDLLHETLNAMEDWD